MSESGSVRDARGKALYAEICRNPDDGALRQVWADWLIEQGDPRGEFIQLQCSGCMDAFTPVIERERALLEAHREEWLGELAPWISLNEWDRGFLTACTLRRPPREWFERVTGAPILSTVRSLGFVDGLADDVTLEHVAAFLAQPELRSLRELWCVPPPLLELLATDSLARLEIIDLHQYQTYRGFLLHPLDARTSSLLEAFPAVHSLAVTLARPVTPAVLEWLWQVAPRYRKLAVTQTPDRTSAAWLLELASLREPGRLEEFEVANSNCREGWSFSFSPDPSGAWSVVRFHRFAPNHMGWASLETLARFLAPLPPDTLTRVIVEPFGPDGEFGPLAKVLERHPRVPRLEVERPPRPRSTLYFEDRFRATH